MTDKTYNINDPIFHDKIQERLQQRTMSLAALGNWATQLDRDCGHFYRVTFPNDDQVMYFEALAGSNVGLVATALYNFAIHFGCDTSCAFNGTKLVVYYLDDEVGQTTT